MITITGQHFKELMTAVTRLPPLGSFAGSEQVNLVAANGTLTATTFGIVLARAKVPCTGDLALVATERRVLEAFAPFCPDASKVTIRVQDNEVLSKCRTHEVASAVAAGNTYKMPPIKDLQGIKVSATAAKRIGYLSEVAFADSSRGELCCVMMTAKGEAIACNQKTVAVLDVSGCQHEGDIAVPLPLAKILEASDILYVGDKETAVKSGIALYSMPSAVKAQKGFPLAAIRQYGKIAAVEVGSLSGLKLGNSASECAACLGQVARTEVIVGFSLNAGKMVLEAINGGARFKAVLQVGGDSVVEFRVPMDGLMQAMPFVGDKAIFKQGPHGELFLGVDNGWVLFPAWEQTKKKK